VQAEPQAGERNASEFEAAESVAASPPSMGPQPRSAAMSDDSEPRDAKEFEEREMRLESTAQAAHFGPQLMGGMVEEEKEVQQYYTRRQDQKVSAGAINRLAEMSAGLSSALSLVQKESSLALVRKAECYMPDTGEFGYSMSYKPKRSADNDQVVTFILETKGKYFVIQGMSAKLTIEGWVYAMPHRAMQIQYLTDSVEIVQRAAAIPAWQVRAGIPALVVLAIILAVSLWVVYGKTGRMSTLVLVPVYNLWVLAEVGNKPGWLSLILSSVFIPVMLGGMIFYGSLAVCAAIMLFISLGVANELGKSVIFGLGLWVLPGVFYPLLAASIE
jgi:hypothetical protein